MRRPSPEKPSALHNHTPSHGGHHLVRRNLETVRRRSLPVLIHFRSSIFPPSPFIDNVALSYLIPVAVLESSWPVTTHHSLIVVRSPHHRSPLIGALPPLTAVFGRGSLSVRWRSSAHRVPPHRSITPHGEWCSTINCSTRSLMGDALSTVVRSPLIDSLLTPA